MNWCVRTDLGLDLIVEEGENWWVRTLARGPRSVGPLLCSKNHLALLDRRRLTWRAPILKAHLLSSMARASLPEALFKVGAHGIDDDALS